MIDEGSLVIVGAGVVGTNVATLAIGHGIPVTLVDLSEDILTQARQTVTQKLRHAQLMGVLPADRRRGELATSTSPDDAAGAVAVIEAVSELPETKAEVLAEVSAIARPGTTLISNTSYIPVDELANWVTRAGDLVGVHFINRPYLVKMVEVVRGPRTSEATMAGVTSLLESLGREPLVINDFPGFVVNKLLHQLINARQCSSRRMSRPPRWWTACSRGTSGIRRARCGPRS